jgi:ELWxxDGT repeat protein
MSSRPIVWLCAPLLLIALFACTSVAPAARLVKDINPGKRSSRIGRIVDVRGTLYFRANDRPHGLELRRSDGSEAGTVLVNDITAERRNSYPSHLTGVGGTLYFAADDGVHGLEFVEERRY